MTPVEELALISRMSAALDDFNDYELAVYCWRYRAYPLESLLPEIYARLDAAALRAQLARRSALSRKAEAA